MHFNWDTAFVLIPLVLGAYFLLTINSWARQLDHPGLRLGLSLFTFLLGGLCLLGLVLFLTAGILGWSLPPWLSLTAG